MHYNQFYHLHAIRVNPYNRVDFGRLAAKNMPIHSATRYQMFQLN